MRRRSTRFVCLAVSLLCGAIMFGVHQPAQALSGITVSPAVQDIALQPNEPSHGFVLTVTNQNKQTQSVRLSALDFGSLNDSGGLIFLGQHADPAQLKYSLTSWLSFDNSVLTLQSGETKHATVTIDNKQSLSPGGHYAAVVVTPVNEDGTSKSSNVQIVPSTSSLLLVRKVGGEVVSLTLNRSSFSHNLFSLPGAGTVRFQNNGNVHVVPRGTVTLTDSRGRLVAKGIINTDSGFILPESYRQYPVMLQAVEHSWLPGQYTITTTTRYDGTDQTNISVVKFYFLGAWLYLFLAIICIALICFVVIKFKLWRKVFHRRRKTPV